MLFWLNIILNFRFHLSFHQVKQYFMVTQKTRSIDSNVHVHYFFAGLLFHYRSIFYLQHLFFIARMIWMMLLPFLIVDVKLPVEIKP